MIFWLVALVLMVIATNFIYKKLKQSMSGATALFVACIVAIVAPVWAINSIEDAWEQSRQSDLDNNKVSGKIEVQPTPQPIPDQTSAPDFKSETNTPEPKKQEEPQEKTFNITPEQFRQKYNNVMAEVKIKYKMPKFKIQKGEANDVFTTYGSKLHGIVGRVDKKTGNLKGVTIICAPKDFAVGLETMMIVAASTDKALGEQKEKNFIIEMTSEALKIFNETKEQVEVRRTVGDNEYMVILNDVAGLWFVIRPKQ